MDPRYHDNDPQALLHSSSVPSTPTSPGPYREDSSGSLHPSNPFSGGSRQPSLQHSPSTSSMLGSTLSPKGSMLLYRFAGEEELRQTWSNRNSATSQYSDTHNLLPTRNGSNRSSGQSFGFGDDVDHKYPLASHHASRSGSPSSMNSPHLGPHAALVTAPSSASTISGTVPRGLIPYVYDPAIESNMPDDDEDILHDPKASPEKVKRLYAPGGLLYNNGKGKKSTGIWTLRGFSNIGLLVLLVAGLVTLFLAYPVISTIMDRARTATIDGNIRVNATGQVPILNGVRELVDKDTPEDVKVRTGFDGETYDLVFSDEFERPGRTFYPGDDPFFEAVDIWYGVTQDLEWYDPQQVSTRDGAMVITMDSADTVQPHLTPGSTAPFTTEENHNLTYRSGMVQTWNKLCFTSGYIEVAVKLPAPGPTAQGYWPGVWTMGNLGRAGFRATTDGMWPYSYDSCDVGTFPNQTDHNNEPASAAFSDKSWPEYDKKLSVLNGQRLSSCTCPNSDHPGPYGKHDSGSNQQRYRGRGAPEIDIIEIQRDNEILVGGVASQSAQFAPFNHDYVFNDSPDVYVIHDRSRTYPNTYTGSPLQQAVSGLSKVPDDGFEIPGGRYVTYGFEYWANPNNRDEGFVTWQVDGKPTVTMKPGSVGPDMGPGGSMVNSRIVPEEPLYAILNMGISNGWTQIRYETLQFPAEMKIDYVRIYQRRGHTNVGCDPPDYPTTQYIQDHLDQYMNRDLTAFNYTKYPKPNNRLYDGC
ncbi:glycoside hydrolase family 16 protein [Moniliophthora roreri MCA 2997]|uniref:Glycoside hydrolase family 16 protein n=2 Tax=Moniliophthora roreri TaxID=221103 RepID=V2WZJ5_MONRO|nr:glycoside hydrolase family 16 protein [Moniliophthora roreri MCA 2997]KAI3599102.1 glycoside hydrolase family 16 protein [Moniliophthora roreri]